MVPAGNQVVGTSDTLLIGGTNIIPQIESRLYNHGALTRPIFSMSAKLGLIEEAHNTVYQWDEIQLDEPSVNCESVVNAGAAGSSFSATIDTLAAVPGDQFEDAATNQLFEIQAVDSQDTDLITSTCTFKKFPSTSAINATTANSMWLRMGNTMFEGGRFKDPTTKTPLRLQNNITQITEQVSVTKLMETQWTYHGQGTFMQQMQAVQDQLDHNIERRTLFGKQYQETRNITRGGGSDGGVARGTKGIWDSIQSKRIPYSTQITEDGLDAVCGKYAFGDAFGGSDVKLCFSGPSVFMNVAKFVKNKFRKLDSKSQYGLTIQEYTSPVGGGTLYFIEESQFMSHNNRDNPHSGTIVGIDPGHFSLMRVYAGLLMVQDTSPKDRTVKSVGIEAAWGNKLRNERFHFIYSQYV